MRVKPTMRAPLLAVLGSVRIFMSPKSTDRRPECLHVHRCCLKTGS